MDSQYLDVDMNAITIPKATVAKTTQRPLNITFANELSRDFVPPDELVQGLLTTHGGSVLCGPQNSGKTNLAIDLAAAVARGTEWMGRKTDAGMVVYLASESPASVKGRLQAYQQYHDVLMPNFVVVGDAINLFKDGADTDAVINAIRMLEESSGKKVKLIVGDTLARLSAGANENAGQDMGLVIERFDHIRNECAAHFMLIHHTGKNIAAGMRGWSGVPAAVDTVIEIVGSSVGSYAEVTKDRDLGVKGARIGFRLNVLEMGRTKWGEIATACIAVPAPAPEKVKRKRRGEVEQAVVDFLSDKAGVSKTQVVSHFSERYAKGPIYRAIKKLCDETTLQDDGGQITLVATLKESS